MVFREENFPYNQTLRWYLNETLNDGMENATNASVVSSANSTNQTDYEWTLPLGGSIFLICDTTISSTWAVMANLLVIVSFFRDPKLRIIQNYYIVSLACSDLLMGGFVMPIGLYAFLYGGSGGGWPIQSKALCKFWNFFDFTNSLQGSLTISLISYDRFKMVIFPIHYRNEETPRRALARIAVTWTFSILFYGPVTLFWDIWQGSSTIGFDECDVEFRDVFWLNTLQSCVEFIMPLVIICTCNISLLLYIQKRRARMIQLRKQMLAKDTVDGATELSSTKQDPKTVAVVATKADIESKNLAEVREIKKEQRATRSLSILVGTFFILWFWYELIGNFVGPICKECVSDVLYKSSYWPQYHICCIDPIIYAITIERFRYHFLTFFSYIFPCCVRHPSQTSSNSKKARVVPMTAISAAADTTRGPSQVSQVSESSTKP